MNAHDFAYWLQGFAELTDAPPSPDQWQAIKDHLALVFSKVTPPRNAADTQRLWAQAQANQYSAAAMNGQVGAHTAMQC
jgi:hypothetical protein